MPTRSGETWKVPFDPEKLKGAKPVKDLIDAKSGEVVVEAGRKVTARLAKQLKDKGVKALKVTDEAIIGRYLAEDIVNLETGEIYAEAGDEITAEDARAVLPTSARSGSRCSRSTTSMWAATSATRSPPTRTRTAKTRSSTSTA